MTEPKVSAGSEVRKPSASFKNDLIDIVANHRKGGRAQPRQTKVRLHDRVKVKNTSGAAIRRGDILEFTDLLFAEVHQEHPYFVGDEPDLTNVGWGVALAPVPSDQVGEFLITGGCVAWVNILDESHEYADRASGEVVLQSQAARGPVKILHKPTGSSPPDERECWVQIMDESGSEEVGIGAGYGSEVYDSAPSTTDTLSFVNPRTVFMSSTELDDSLGHVTYEELGGDIFAFKAQEDLLVEYWFVVRVHYHHGSGTPAQGDNYANFFVTGGSFDDDFCGNALAIIPKGWPHSQHNTASGTGFFRIHADEFFYFNGQLFSGADDIRIDDFFCHFQTRVRPFA